MTKSCTWQSPLVTRNFKTPTGPLAEVDPGMCYDFSHQRTIMPDQIGPRQHRQRTMNAGGGAAHALVGSLDTNGTDSPFVAPFVK
jgi:hypothetical protein